MSEERYSTTTGARIDPWKRIEHICAENADLRLEVSRLRSSLKDVIRICEAVRLSAGLGKSQIARLEQAKACLPPTDTNSRAVGIAVYPSSSDSSVGG